MTSGDAPKLTLYDTYSRKKQPFTPLDASNVRMYVCGPTVYDYAHIGNARPVIVFDVLYRLLRHVYGEDHVTYVRNITDVDDKINARAVRDYPDLPLNEAIRNVTEKTAKQYFADTKALGCLEPNQQPRATDYISPRTDTPYTMISLIEKLVAKGNAYQAGGEVLFDTTSMPDYGALSNRSLDDQQAGARIAVEAHKRNPGDFVLWKQSGDNEPGWESPWGWGRPGWHIECSAMSAALLGEEFDIHGGGLDLIFPHHENELAQSRCAHGTTTMAQVWMHNGFLQVEGKKMSKSDGNFITINELLETEKFGGRKWPGDVLRLAMLMTHYREPIDFSLARLDEAESVLTRWKNAILTLGLDFAEKKRVEVRSLGPCSKLLAALSNDLNMAGVVAELHRHAGSKELHNANRLFGSLQLLGILTFDLMQAYQKAQGEKPAVEGADDISSAVAARLDALNAKDFAKADEIRDELTEKGIQLMDSKDPDTGERVTKWEVKS